VERFLGDNALENGYKFPQPAKKLGKKVLIVGSGPAGLSAAYQLALKGWDVTVKEGSPLAGGMMRYGIPKYRLPRRVLDAEIQRILDLGVRLELNTTVTDLEKEKSENGFEAVFLAVGASLAKRAYIPGGDAKHMLDAVNVLRSMEGEGEPLLGRRVVVYGGGNTAIDVARSAKRLGAEPLIIYRRTRDKMPAHDFEVEEALEEGVSVKWLSTIKEADSKEIKIEKMRLDEEGHPQPTGEFETVEADAVVLALGQNVDLGLLEKLKGLNIVDGVVQVDSNMFTGVPGIYAGGDMVPGDRNVTVAIGHGYKAARAIDAYLRGEEPVIPAKHDVAEFKSLNTWYYSDAPKTVRPQLDIVRRQNTFDEVQHGLTEENALFEARRCLSCGNCLQCDNCYGVCPDNAVIKTGEEKVPYIFNYDYCKGCGICSSECPCGCIKMEAESI
jgi:NADPH-dependent glutamate synthase beta subunit-like oxidoreductase